MTYDGDFHTPSGEDFSVELDAFSFGVLSDGNPGNDLFNNAFNNDTTNHDVPVTLTANIADATLNAILADGSVNVKFTDIASTGDWIDWVDIMDWQITFDDAPVADVPAPASLILWSMGGGLAFLGKKLRRGRKTEAAA